MANLQAGAIGAVLEVTVVDEHRAPIPISTATVKRILITKPNNTVLTKTASFLTDGTDGKLTWTTIADDLVGGTNKIRAYLEMPDYTGNTAIERFEVDP